MICPIYIVTAMAIIIVVFTRGTTESILQAILCAVVAVYGNQLVKQAKKSGDN